MKNEFISYEQALALKELGFNERCLGYYYNGKLTLNPDAPIDIDAPLCQQAFRWFRKEHGLYSSIIPKKSWPDDYVTGIEFYVSICGGDGKEIGPEGVFSCEEAEQACLDKLIEIVKTNK